ncbi:MAG: hypothetical protein V4621_03870 [Pseudomonadota bacterium]
MQSATEKTPSRPTDRPTLGLGILSWRGYASLRAALTTYRDAGFFTLFDDVLLFLPQIEKEGIAVALEFGIPYAGSTDNLGILGGNQALASVMTSDIILMVENDYMLRETLDSAQAQLHRGVTALASGQADVVRFRHRHLPGELWQMWKTHRYWPRSDAPYVDKLKSAVLRLFRGGKANRLLGNTIFTHDDAAKQFPDAIQRRNGVDFFTSSRHINWANNAYMVRRSWFLETIIPGALAQKTTRLVNGFPTIETELNSQWWRDQDFTIAIADPGLFEHRRMNDRGY